MRKEKFKFEKSIITFNNGIINISKDEARILDYAFTIAHVIFASELPFGITQLFAKVPLLDNFFGNSEADKVKLAKCMDSLFEKASVEFDFVPKKGCDTLVISAHLISGVFTMDFDKKCVRLLTLSKPDFGTDSTDCDNFIHGIIWDRISDIANNEDN